MGTPELASWVSTQAGWDGSPLELTGAGSPPAARQTPCLLCNPLHEALALLPSPCGQRGWIHPAQLILGAIGGPQNQTDSGSCWTAPLGPLPGGAACQAGSSAQRGREEGGFSLQWGSASPCASQDGQPLSSEARKPVGMDALTGLKRKAQKRVRRREKSGRSRSSRLGGEHVSQLLPPILTLRQGALPALGSFPSPSETRFPPSSLQALLPILRIPSLPALPAPTVPQPRSRAHAPLPAGWHWAAAGRAGARCWHAGLEMLAHVRPVVQTGSGTCRNPRASPQALPPLRRTPPHRRPLPQKACRVPGVKGVAGWLAVPEPRRMALAAAGS